jgi:hypothetical protein
MPPAVKRPTSSIAQVVQVAADGKPPAATDPSTSEGPLTPATLQDESKPERPKTNERPKSTPAAAPAGGAGRKASRRGEAVASSPKSAVRKPLLLNLDEDLKQRMVNTVVWTGPRTGLRNQQAFIRRAIAELCERFELEHNHGKPFDLVEDAAEA